jgi:hypothetical protein
VYWNVKADPSKMKEMMELSDGGRRVPVIVDGSDVTVGFGGT